MATTIRVKGLDQAIASLDETQRRLLDLTPVFRVAGEDLKTLIDDSFETSRAPNGQPWETLKPATIRKRRQRSSKPLVDTGVLRNSISYSASARTLRFGTNVPYAGFHQFGTEHIPPRPFLPVEPAGDGFTLMRTGPAGDELAAIEQMIVDYILTGKLR